MTRRATQTDVLVLSPSCFTAINRAPFRVLADRGYNVAIVVPKTRGFGGDLQDADPQQPGDPETILVDTVGTHQRMWTFKGLHSLLAEHRPAIVMIDADPGSRIAIEVGLHQKRRGGKTATTSCDNMPRTLIGELRRHVRTGLKFSVTSVLSTTARAVVDHVFSLTSDIVAVNHTKGFGARTSIMRLGFDPGIFYVDAAKRAEKREALGLGDTPCFAYFGRAAPEKGVHILLDALARLQDAEWTLLFDDFSRYTSDYSRQIAQQIDDLGLRSRVRNFDASHTEIAAYMNAADIVVAPSVSSARAKEQYGRVVPEAMACGCALVISRSGALPELLGDAGLTVEEGDPAALAAALRRFLDEPGLRDELATRSLARAPQFNIDAQADALEAVFRPWLEARR